MHELTFERTMIMNIELWKNNQELFKQEFKKVVRRISKPIQNYIGVILMQRNVCRDSLSCQEY